MLRVDQPGVMQLGTPECPGGLRAGWPLLVVPVVVELVTGTFRVLQYGPALLDCYKDFFHGHFATQTVDNPSGPRQAISNLSVTSP